jgi:hypothetical protein
MEYRAPPTACPPACFIAGVLRLVVATAALVAGGLAPAVAQDEPELVTDRPDQTESTAIVPPGRTQVELGATLVRNDEAEIGVELWQVPGTLVRVGLGDRVELRLGWDGWLEEEIEVGRAGATEDGFGDASIGAKVRLRDGGGLSPTISLIASSSVPAGEEPFSSDRFDPAFRLTVSHDLDGGIGLGYNVGLETASEPKVEGGSTTLASAIYTLSAGFPAGERGGFFVELFGEVPTSAEGGPAHLFDAGVTWLMRPNVQLDAAAGVGLSDDAPDWFAGVGLSVRLPR